MIDDADGSKSGTIWNIYYHLYLDEESYQILQDQSEKLYVLSNTIDSWHQSEYGTVLRICDGRSLARIRKAWNSYNTTRMSKEHFKSYEEHLKSKLQRAKDTKEARTGSAIVLTGFRSTAPVGLLALEDLPQLHRAFWETGTTDESNDSLCTTLCANPMFATSAKNTSSLHYGTDPLLGFHLATAYAPLLPESPLKANLFDIPGLRKVVEAAKVQFRAWSRSFRNRVPKNITVRFFTGDALSFCYALQHQGSTSGNSAPNLYRDPYHSDPLVLNESDYGVMSSASTAFNVIDTSNLLDHLGALNLLVASSPLLSKELAATLYTETFVKRQKNLRAMSDELLCGHFPTVSILLGLFPMEYWTNATAISTVDEAMLDLVSHKMTGSEDNAGQMYCRFAWKRVPTEQVSSTMQTSSGLSLADIDLANLLFGIYQKMFEHENMGLLLSDMSLQRLKNNSCPRYHRGSLAAFFALLKTKLSADWNSAMERFLDLVETDSSLLVGRNYIQELYLYLHIFGIYSVPTFKQGSHVQEKHLELGTTETLKKSSPVLCITLRVPRSVLKPFMEIPYTELGTPPLQCVLQSSRKFAGKPWQNIFSVVQLAFGDAIMSGTGQGDDPKLLIQDDDDGWMGKSPLLVSFYVPSWITHLEPQTATVALGIQSTPQSTRTFIKHFGLELKIYETHLGNEENVYLTRYAPNQSGRTCVCQPVELEKTSPQPADDPFDTVITPVVDIKMARITALTGRINLKSKRAQDIFREGAEAATAQTSACVITVRIGKELQYRLYFPAPVIQTRCKLRLARKSSYIEVVVPIASLGGQDHLQHFMYPTFLEKSIPVNWNLPRLNLDRLPVLDITKTKDMQWLVTHASLTFSTRERTLRDTPTKMINGIHDNVRLNYKESLFTIFMSFSGLQGARSNVFGLSDSTRGGVSIIIIGSRLRLDLANHTVVLDAAVLPLTDSLMPKIRSFLQTITDMGVHTIHMNDDEVRLWKQTITAYVERCRDWSHTSSCEYLVGSSIPISFEGKEDFICSCGKGKLPSGFTTGIPGWKTVSKHAFRIALSPSFSVPYVEGVCEIDKSRLSSIDADGCDACGKSKRNGGVALLKCGRCRTAKYCSVECQRAKWKDHKKACKEIAVNE